MRLPPASLSALTSSADLPAATVLNVDTHTASLCTQLNLKSQVQLTRWEKGFGFELLINLALKAVIN